MAEENDEKLQYPPERIYNEAKKEFKYPAPGHKIRVFVHRVYGSCNCSVEGDEAFNSHMSINEMRRGISSKVPNYVIPGAPFICPWAFNGIASYMIAMSFGVTAVELGIAKEGEDGYVICPAWGPPTCEAVVIFRLHPEPFEMSEFDWGYETYARNGHPFVPKYFRENFGPEDIEEVRKKEIDEWLKAGKPKFFERWRNPSYQPQRKKKK